MVSDGVAMTGHSSAKMVTLHIPQTPGKKYSSQRDFAKFELRVWLAKILRSSKPVVNHDYNVAGKHPNFSSTSVFEHPFT